MVSFIFARYVFEILLTRVPSTINFIYTDVSEMFNTYAKVGIYTGIALASPIIIYEMIAFVRPALNKKEMGYIYTTLPIIFGFFFFGILYGFYVVLPPMLRLLIQYQWIPEVGTRIIPMIKIGSFISFSISTLFWVGLSFELPAVIFLLAKIGIISHHMLVKHWKWIVISIFVVSSAITPWGNPANQSVSDILLLDFSFILSGPILFLYFTSILFAWLARRPKKVVFVSSPSQA
jgi:sec-independent protein translocase protein TatC